MHRTPRCLTPMYVLVAVLSAAACGGSTSPGQSVGLKQPDALVNAIGQVGGLFEQSVYASYTSFSSYFDAAGLAPPAALRNIIARGERSSLQPLSSSSRRWTGGPTIDPLRLGNSWTWDVQQQLYVEQQGGGPADGVRFALYEVPGRFGAPVLPLNQIGYADIRELGTASVTGIRTVLVRGAVTEGDFTFLLGATGDFAFAGFVTHAGVRIDFTATALPTAAGYEFHFTQFDVTSPDLVQTLDFTHTATAAGSDDLTAFTLTRNSQLLSLTGTETLTTGDPLIVVDYLFSVDGTPVAKIITAGPAGDQGAVIRTIDDQSLTAAEEDAVEAVWNESVVPRMLLTDLSLPAFRTYGLFSLYD